MLLYLRTPLLQFLFDSWVSSLESRQKLKEPFSFSMIMIMIGYWKDNLGTVDNIQEG